jgi:hypothetical protein
MATTLVPTPALRRIQASLELFVAGSDGELYSLSQVVPNDGWSSWERIQNPDCLSIAKSPVIGAVNYMNLIGPGVYVVTPNGSLYGRQKPFADEPFSDWVFLGGPFAETPAVGVNAGGVEWIFIVGLDNILYRLAVGVNAWIPWPAARVIGTPAVGNSRDGRLEVFVLGTDGSLLHRWERNLRSTAWSDWHSHGDPGVALTPSPAIGASADGRLELFVVGADGALYHIWQTAVNQGWSDWHSHGDPGVALMPSPAIGASKDGRLELFAVGADGALYHIWQTAVNQGWSDWHSHGDPGVALMSSLAIGASADGRLELFVVGADGALYHIWQTAVNEGWSDWHSHGSPQPFDIFPIAWYDLDGYYGHPAEIVEETGINSVLVYNRGDVPNYLNALQATGLRAIVQLPRPITAEGLKQFIHDLKHRSEIGGWYLTDEPPGNDRVYPDVALDNYQVMKTEDPTRPVSIVFAWNSEVQEYSDAMDIYGVDHYLGLESNEFEGSTPGPGYRLVNGEYFKFLSDKAVNAVGKRAYWIVLQSEEVFGHRFPTPAELRYLIYASIQAGANGIFFYRFDESVAQDPTWVDTVHAPVVREFAPHATVFANRPITGKVTTLEPFTEARLYRTRTEENIGYLLLLVHHNSGTVTVDVAFDALLQITQVIRNDNGLPLDLSNNTFTDTLGPFEVRLYDLS